MNLKSLENLLLLQLDRAEIQFKAALSLAAVSQRHQRRHILEGVVSDSWQAYCTFVRQLCIRSSTGCVTCMGVVHAASVMPANWQRVSYVACQAARNRAV